MITCLFGQIIIIREIVDHFGSSFFSIVYFLYKSNETIESNITFDYGIIIINYDYFVNSIDDIFNYFFEK